MATIGILGAGTWGTALACTAVQNDNTVTLWSDREKTLSCLYRERRHPHLTNVTLPESVKLTSNLETACRKQDLIIFAVPSVAVRATAEKAAAFLAPGQTVADAAKGIEAGTLLTMTQILAEILPDIHPVALSGPTHAEEVAIGLPAAIVAASTDLSAARRVQDILIHPNFRVYTNDDVLGVELAGALKNIIAIACGISDGLGNGDNTKAALVTRGLAEITRLGTAAGCRPETFSGLAGIGDLMVTVSSRHSRNSRAGRLIGQGRSPEQAVEEIGMVVEGLNALPAALQLGQKYKVELPITEAIRDVCEGLPPREAVIRLMTRQKNSEAGNG